MGTMIKGASGAAGKARENGVRRKLWIDVKGDVTTLTFRTMSGTTGATVSVATDRLTESLGNRVPIDLDASGASGGVGPTLRVNRSAADGPVDLGRAYLWVRTPGDPDGWDFLGSREELLRALRADESA